MAVREAEQAEGLALQRGGAGDHGECRYVVGGLDVVGADGGQVGEQAGETVYRGVVVGAFACGFGQCGIGALGWIDGVSAFGGSVDDRPLKRNRWARAPGATSAA